MYPALPLEDWKPTRDTLRGYALLLGDIRCAHMPRQRHWQHCSLRVTARGLTTTPFPIDNAIAEMELDLAAHALRIRVAQGGQEDIPLRGQSRAVLFERMVAAFRSMGLELRHESPDEDLADTTYDRTAVERWHAAAVHVHQVLQKFKGEHRGETAPVQLWPHHFDLAMLAFSGERVDGEDPGDEDMADEQMNFGFSTGDEGIPEAYFYATAYPAPDGLAEQPLPGEAHWETEGFTGAVLPYTAVQKGEDGDERLLAFLRAAERAVASLRTEH